MPSTRSSLTRFLASALLVVAGSMAVTADDAAPAAVGATEAAAKLRVGNGRFALNEPGSPDISSARRKVIAGGQTPYAVVLTCADSRVAPEYVFNAGLGDLFVCRVAGNVADTNVLGSIEYAVEHLHAPLIVVMGHSKCGAVAAALAGGAPHGNLGSLLESVHVGEGLPEGKDEKLAAAIAHNAEFQADALTTHSEVIREFVKSGKVKIVTAVYDLATGRVEWLPAKVAAPATK